MHQSALPKIHTHKKNFQNPPGFELIEILVTLGLLSFLFMVMLSSTVILQLQDNAYHRVLARQLMTEESEALRNGSYATLQRYTDQPAAGFLNVAYPTGAWTVQAPAAPCTVPTPCSGGNALHAALATGAANPSRYVVPAGRLGDGTYDLHFRVQNTSQPGWAVGMYVRYRDDRNHYLLQADATTLKFIKVDRGIVTPLWTVNQPFSSTGATWYQLTVTAMGTSFALALNGVAQTTVTDGAFLDGQFLLGVLAGAEADFDDVKYTNNGTGTTLVWNFSSAGDVTGKPPYGWKRIGLSDLLGGATSITIANAQSGYTDLKRVDLSVSWYERGGAKTIRNTFYINRYSVAP